MDVIKGAFKKILVWLTVLFFYGKIAFSYLARLYEPRLHTKGKYNHCVVIIGDDHAMGVCDYSTLTFGSGLTHKLAVEFDKEKTVRQSWQYFNRGEYRTTTEDWLLPADSKRKEKPTLLAKTLADPKVIKAEILILMVGSNDALKTGSSAITPEDTLRNIELICQALRRSGNTEKSIYLCTIPTAGDEDYLTAEQQSDNHKRNVLINDYIKDNQDNILAGVQLDRQSNFEFKRRNLYWSDGRHFGETGYTKIAKDFVPLIKHDMIKREFALFQRDWVVPE